MDYVEADGDTIDEAIKNVLRILGVERDKVTVDILTEGVKGFFGIGAKKARVRASLRKPLVEDEEERVESKPAEANRITEEEAAAAGQRAKEVLGEILSLMGIKATVEMKPGETEAEIVLEIHGDNGGLLIGRKGQTLEAMQYLVTRITTERQGKEAPQLVVDTENYRERRRKSLEDMALRLGEKVKRQRKTVTVDALSAADRRIIHLALQDDPWLTTKSLGQGPYRRLLIIPEGDRKGQPSGRPGGRGQK